MSVAKRAAPRPAAKRVAKPPATKRPVTPPAKASARAPKAAAVNDPLQGKSVPAFVLPATGGHTWRSTDARGRKLVLYFYPRDNTPGCTLEGQQFAALSTRFDAADTTVLGISRDTIAAHERFRSQMGFPFQLLSDVDGKVCSLFDVIREKNMYGRKLVGIERTTFLIDANGMVQQVWRKVRSDGHAQAVLEAAQSL